MLADVHQTREEMRKRYVPSLRHTVQVDYIDYADELAALIGCKPSFWPIFLRDPKVTNAARPEALPSIAMLTDVALPCGWPAVGPCSSPSPCGRPASCRRSTASSARARGRVRAMRSWEPRTASCSPTRAASTSATLRPRGT